MRRLVALRRDSRNHRKESAAAAEAARLGSHPVLAARLGHGSSHRKRGDLERLDAREQRSHQARGRPVSGEFCRRVPAAAIAGSAHCQLRCRARALCTRVEFCRLQLEPRSFRRALDSPTAHRPALVPLLREDGRAGCPGDDPRLRLVQSEFPRHRRALHQRRHHGVHAVHRGRSVRGFSHAALHHSARRRGRSLPLGPIPRTRRHAQAPPARGTRDEERVLRHVRVSPAGHRSSGACHRHRQHSVRVGDGGRRARHRSAHRPLLR